MSARKTSPSQADESMETREGEQHAPFPFAEGKQLGYATEPVDAFLARARATYEDPKQLDDPITSVEVRRAAFPVKKRGYSARHVDAAMDRLEEVFFERERRARVRTEGEDAWWAETRKLLSEVRGRLERPRGRRFNRRGLLATGYRRAEVDAFLDRIAAMFAHREMTLDASEVRDVVFHSQLRGYDEDQVDALLDSVVELILSTK